MLADAAARSAGSLAHIAHREQSADTSPQRNLEWHAY